MRRLELHIVLVAPEIAPNTGNIARTCAALGARLHLVRPFGFRLTDKMLRRAGLDYWQHVDVVLYDDWAHFQATHGTARCFFFTTQARQTYDKVRYADGSMLVFGSESTGLPDSVLAEAPEQQWVRIPMRPGIRSLNVANAASIVAYEAARQQGFAGLV